MSLVKQVIETADEELRYLTPGELQMFQGFCKTGERRIRIAQTLMDHEADLVKLGSRRFWQRCPITPSNSGNPRKTASCQRDQGWYIRLIAYCVLAGSEQPLADIGTLGMKEMYRSLGIPLANWAEAVKCLKEETLLLLKDDAAEVAPYFDHILQFLALPGTPYFVSGK
ncbi:MAG: allophycocyanin subunit alpha-B [Oculatellaceae cyanobacterium Prado106]|nr:allophycocyanin subunit alpha-B [Oculatellaceae cyanobacterium Prado106]